jgi:hypothetical protein
MAGGESEHTTPEEIDDPVFGRLIVRVDGPGPGRAEEAGSSRRPGRLAMVGMFFDAFFGASERERRQAVRRVAPTDVQRDAFRQLVTRSPELLEEIRKRAGEALVLDGRPVGAAEAWRHMRGPFAEVRVSEESPSVVLINLHWDTALDDEHGYLETAEVNGREVTLWK